MAHNTQYKLAEIELNKSELFQVRQAIAEMDIDVFIYPAVKIGYDIVSCCYGDLMELFDLISFELNLVEQDIITI